MPIVIKGTLLKIKRHRPVGCIPFIPCQVATEFNTLSVLFKYITSGKFMYKIYVVLI